MGAGAYNLSNIYMPLFTKSNQSSGKQSKLRDITRSRSQFSMRTETQGFVTAEQVKIPFGSDKKNSLDKCNSFVC